MEPLRAGPSGRQPPTVPLAKRRPTARSARARSLGRAGEDAAADWYRARGYDVLARNWCCRAGEIDVVARQGLLTVFCEVKSRTSVAFGTPGEAVGPLKRSRLRRLAAIWFAAQQPAAPGHRRGGPVRFDVASVLGQSVEVLEGAF